MDRASIKLKKVLDALMLERTMTGTRLVPRSIKQLHLLQTYSNKVDTDYYMACVKLDNQMSTRTIPMLLANKI